MNEEKILFVLTKMSELMEKLNDRVMALEKRMDEKVSKPKKEFDCDKRRYNGSGDL